MTCEIQIRETTTDRQRTDAAAFRRRSAERFEPCLDFVSAGRRGSPHRIDTPNSGEPTRALPRAARHRARYERRTT